MLGIWVYSRDCVSWTVCRRLVSRSNHDRIPGVRGYASQSPDSTKSRSSKLKRGISTLHRDLIQDSDFLDLSTRIYSLIYIRPITTATTTPSASIRYFGQNGCFPGKCYGFLYYYRDPLLPAVSGAVRFRLTPDAKASSFSAGTDLMLPDGATPWRIGLATIATSRSYAAFRQVLLKDALISPSVLQQSRDIGKHHKSHHCMLYTLEQPFVFNLGISLSILAVRPHGIERAEMTIMNARTRKNGRWSTHRPYAGQIRVRFEQSLAPEHAGRRVIVIRVLEILKPITLAVPEYSGSLESPRAGSLLTRKGRPIVIDVDECDSQVRKCLRLLVSKAP